MIVDLAFDRIDGDHPDRVIAFLHGILGRGINLRNIAKRFVEARPDWTAWLIDLRGHGRSPKHTAGPSLESAAGDVIALGQKADLPFAAIAGHSFGGKVALETARLNGLNSLTHIVTIDSMPGSRTPIRSGDSALAVIDTIASLPRTFASRQDFIRAFVATGKSRTLADWLAGSVQRENGQTRFSLDLEELRALLLDYFARDLWPVVEHPPDGVHVHLMIGEQSTSYSADDRERALKAAASNPFVTADIMPGGHWLHVDNPEGVLSGLQGKLGTESKF
jgi:pimeloyl-ACP methyl ester carboxylesterase